MYQIAIISDIHLDLIFPFQRKLIAEQISQNADSDLINILLLAGDISSCHTIKGKKCLSKFYKKVSKFYRHVIMVMGNHEHRNGNYLNTKEILEDIGYVVLDCDIWTDGKIKIAGCTLWSLIPESEKSSPDLTNIYYGDRLFSAKIYNQIHNEHRLWLENVEDVDIVMTHHAPLKNKGCSDPKFDKFPNYFFESDLSHIVSKHKIWICGHTHHRNVFKEKSCLMIINCLGYAEEHQGLYLQNILF